MLDRGVSLLWRHPPFKSADLTQVSPPSCSSNTQLTVKPARCNRKAQRSRNETNCELQGISNRQGKSKETYKTRDLMVESCSLSLWSSSTSASSFVDDRHF